MPPYSSPWTPAPYDASMVLEEEEDEEEEDFAVEYVEYDNCLWGRQWDSARQQYCWWLASADGSQVGEAPLYSLDVEVLPLPGKSAKAGQQQVQE